MLYDASGRTLAVSNNLAEKVVSTRDAAGREISVQTYATNSVAPLRVTITSYRANHHGFTLQERA